MVSDSLEWGMCSLSISTMVNRSEGDLTHTDSTMTTTFPTTNVEEWREANLGLAFVTPRLEAWTMMAAKDEKYQGGLDNDQERWTELVKLNMASPAPYRDNVIRNKAFAFSKVNCFGQMSEDTEAFVEAYQAAFRMEWFVAENDYISSRLTEDERARQHEAGYDMDLSYYIEVLAFYYCNRLCNLADGGDRDVVSVDSPEHARLVELTKKLEERKMFDEMYLVRVGVAGAFSAFTGPSWKPDGIKFMEDAVVMLSELYNVPVAA
ncbi:hypothetical protein SynBIOSE41_00833 [Synechococcus sp. BIOS-E4-1]|uniref:hypothetical protein n=1 Tax=Synechococcus sp. BIOS-E4-1 TaxID=1400864 RepID=UPI001860026A|nr:hypothetical protein [Synechococcus sp. BIOS-E4-1]QNI53365.1 hypothetical protein SynBIOSE41_00833 [Synechococcus sp. BIOS-E4-1]